MWAKKSPEGNCRRGYGQPVTRLGMGMVVKVVGGGRKRPRQCSAGMNLLAAMNIGHHGRNRTNN
tara:strand:- start:2053 stop:2244 length:192 start_codon:yes stop_codon:yes gene_type:complete